MTMDEPNEGPGSPSNATGNEQCGLNRAEKRKKKHYMRQKDKKRWQRTQSEQAPINGTNATQAHENPPSMFEEGISSNAKGIGLFATSAICSGTLLISEKPLLQLPYDATAEQVIHAAQSLPNEKQTTYANLSRGGATSENYWNSNIEHFSPYQQSLAQIWRINTFNTPQHTQAVYATSSRVNHSCTPTIMFSHRTDNATLVAHAVRDLDPGDELTWSYIDVYQGVAARHHYLAHTCFDMGDCRCDVCREDTPSQVWRKQVSDERRQRIAELRGLLVGFKIDAGVKAKEQGMRWGLELEKLLLEEKLVGVELAKCYSLLASVRCRVGGPEMGIGYKRKEFEVLRCCFGADSPRARVCEVELRSLESGEVPAVDARAFVF